MFGQSQRARAKRLSGRGKKCDGKNVAPLQWVAKNWQNWQWLNCAHNVSEQKREKCLGKLVDVLERIRVCARSVFVCASGADTPLHTRNVCTHPHAYTQVPNAPKWTQCTHADACGCMHVKRACVDQALLFATPAAVHNQPLYPGCDFVAPDPFCPVPPETPANNRTILPSAVARSLSRPESCVAR